MCGAQIQGPAFRAQRSGSSIRGPALQVQSSGSSDRGPELGVQLSGLWVFLLHVLVGVCLARGTLNGDWQSQGPCAPGAPRAEAPRAALRGRSEVQIWHARPSGGTFGIHEHRDLLVNRACGQGEPSSGRGRWAVAPACPTLAHTSGTGAGGTLSTAGDAPWQSPTGINEDITHPSAHPPCEPVCSEC